MLLLYASSLLYGTWNDASTMLLHALIQLASQAQMETKHANVPFGLGLCAQQKRWILSSLPLVSRCSKTHSHGGGGRVELREQRMFVQACR